MEYENKVVRVQRVFFHSLPDMIENWGKEGYRIINTNQSKTFSGEEEIVIFLEREIKEKQIKTNLSENAFDLINRQKAEIESLRSQCSAKDVIINSQEAEIERLEKILDKRCDKCPAVITAIKKFINELEARCTEGGIYPAFVARTAENIAEEMTKKGEN